MLVRGNNAIVLIWKSFEEWQRSLDAPASRKRNARIYPGKYGQEFE
jgi:hypothetical protein